MRLPANSFSSRPTGKRLTKPSSSSSPGRGSNMQALLDARLPARVAAVISNNPQARGLGYRASARRRHRRGGSPRLSRPRRVRRALAAEIDRHRPDLVVLAGFMRILTTPFVERYRGRLINIHPSLLPAFTGLDTHRRALAAGVRMHGCTVHFVTPAVDSGPIIVQAAVPVLRGGHRGAAGRPRARRGAPHLPAGRALVLRRTAATRTGWHGDGGCGARRGRRPHFAGARSRLTAWTMRLASALAVARHSCLRLPAPLPRPPPRNWSRPVTTCPATACTSRSCTRLSRRRTTTFRIVSETRAVGLLALFERQPLRVVSSGLVDGLGPAVRCSSRASAANPTRARCAASSTGKPAG